MLISRLRVYYMLPVGLFSLNVKLPLNNHTGPYYNYFAMVLLLLCGIETIFITIARRWWIRAKRTRSRLS